MNAPSKFKVGDFVIVLAVTDYVRNDITRFSQYKEWIGNPAVIIECLNSENSEFSYEVKSLKKLEYSTIKVFEDQILLVNINSDKNLQNACDLAVI